MPMKVNNPIGQSRTEPSSCQVGDWVTSSSVPEWDFDRNYPFQGEDPATEPKVFKLFPYVDGKRQLVWIRIG